MRRLRWNRGASSSGDGYFYKPVQSWTSAGGAALRLSLN